MLFLSNLHTHTVYCDGSDTPAAMAQAAFAKGFVSLGFSGHAYLEGEDWCMTPGGEKEYICKVEDLRREYAGKMEIYLGLEHDYYSAYTPQRLACFDYVIGSVHGVKGPDGTIHFVDAEAGHFEKGIETFGGIQGFAQEYYALLVRMAREQKPDIIGHFDLFIKNNRDGCYFDENAGWYRELAVSAADEIAKTGCIVEVNTGGLPRGYRKEPYPALFILKRLREKGAPVTISSDSHETGTIDFGFLQAQELLREAGFCSVKMLRGGKFEDVSLL